jgi:hypothetical protein
MNTCTDTCPPGLREANSGGNLPSIPILLLLNINMSRHIYVLFLFIFCPLKLASQSPGGEFTIYPPTLTPKHRHVATSLCSFLFFMFCPWNWLRRVQGAKFTIYPPTLTPKHKYVTPYLCSFLFFVGCPLKLASQSPGGCGYWRSQPQ